GGTARGRCDSGTAERERGGMLEAARIEVEEAGRTAAAIQEAAERKRDGMLHAARLEVEEGRRVRKAAETGRAGMLRDAVATLTAAQQEAAGIVEAAEGERVAAQAAAQGRQVRVLFYGELEA
ncbi:hypothetical protein T484DRAFT_1942287, partial [Baffinella frigidus]